MLETTVSPRNEIQPLSQQLEARIRAVREFPAVASVSYTAADSLEWLRGQDDATKIAWSDRGDTKLVAAVGSAKCLEAAIGESVDQLIRRCRAVLSGNQHLRFYGGFSFRFDNSSIDPQWQPFSRAKFWLPRLTYDGHQLGVTITSADDATEAIRAVRRMNLDTRGPSLNLPTVVSRTDQPDISAWTENVRQSLRMIADEVLEKVVLARKATFTFSEPIDAVDLVGRLACETRACYHFLFQPESGIAFVGATPERLFRREGNQLRSEAIAGTRRRGMNPDEDDQLASELKASIKDQLEHDIVRKSMRQRLHKCVSKLVVDSSASVLKLARKQHLYSRVTATLKPDVTDGDLIDRLHPTPAVGGYPTGNALSEIDRLEPFDRGWYAGPVGWVGAKSAEFAVAIRSGLVVGDQMSLYSGAGIVPGSTAHQEWEEIENKIGDFLDVIQPG